MPRGRPASLRLVPAEAAARISSAVVSGRPAAVAAWLSVSRAASGSMPPAMPSESTSRPRAPAAATTAAAAR